MNTKEKPTNKDEILGTSIRSIYEIVQSVFLKTFQVGMIYLAGLINLNPCWLIAVLVVFIYRDKKRTVHKFDQQVSISVTLRNEEQIILPNVNQPQPWVRFPKVEQCEWLNKILYHVWPDMNKYTENLLKTKVEPKINEAMSRYKSNPNFVFQTIRLGSIVPRICGLKVYKNYSRQFEYIIVDIKLFYAGDTELYFYLMSLGGGVQNIEISGWLRIVFRLLVQPSPALGGIEIFFLHKPKVDYNFAGAMEILKIPGISGMLRRTIDDQLSSQMVLPRKITIPMNDIVNSGYWKCPDPDGLVQIHVVEGKDLSGAISSTYGPDSYVMITFGSQTAVSKYFENSLYPKWKFWADFMIDNSSFDEYFVINVNERSDNKILGTVSIELDVAKKRKNLRSWVQLEDTTTGMILLEMYYYNLTFNIHDSHIMSLPYVLVVFINVALNLVNPETNKEPNSVVYLQINEDTKVSKPVLSTNPVFEEAILFIINDDPKNNILKLNLVDTNDKKNLGNATLQLKRVCEANFMEVIDQWCPLLGAATESSLSLSMRLRVLKH